MLVAMMITPPKLSPSLEFALFSHTATFDEQYESIPDNEIVLLTRKFWVMHMFLKERRRNSQVCFECSDTTHFIVDCPKRKKYDYSNKNDYNKKNDNKNDYKKKNRFGSKKKNIKNIMSWACAALSDFDFSIKDSSSTEEDENVNYKKKEGDFTGLCLMTHERSL
jgi:hypothetical protein